MTQPTERRFVMEPRLDAEVQALETAVSNEVTARTNADTNLQNQINDIKQTSRVYVKNGSTPLTKGTPVYITGADGTNVIIGAASNASEATSSKVIGLTETDLTANAMGYVVTDGRLVNIDTSGAGAAGDAVWLGVNGAKLYGLASKPVAPAHMVYLGVVSRKNANTGEIEVKIQNGFELDELHDVSITSPAAGNIIIRNAGNTLWENKPQSNLTISKTQVTGTAITAADTGTVTSTMIADGTIATGDIADGAITTAKIATGAVVTDDIADSAVTSAKIANGTIVDADVSASAAIAFTKVTRPPLSNASDVVLTTPTNGQALTYNGTNWVNATPVNALSGLSDVTITTPTGGQVIKYNAGTSKWVNGPAAGGVTASDTAPSLSTAAAGDAWFDTNDGTLYVCYVDTDSTKQWVQVQANSALEASILSRLGALESTSVAFGNMSSNYIINSAFDIWQRGTGLATATSATTGFVSDRWQMWRAGYATGGSTYKPAGPTGFESAARVQRDAGNTSTALISLTQSIESSMSIPLAGQTVTLSFYARSGANFSSASSILNPYIISGTGSNQNISAGFTGYAVTATANSALTTSWQRFSITGTVSSAATQLAVQFAYTPVGTAGASDYFEVTGVQLERGTVATAFRRNQPNIQAELAACQRYYQVYGGDPTSIIIAQGCVSTSTNAVINLPLLVEMRSAPTFSYGPLAEFRQHVPGVVISTPTSISLNISSTKLVSINTTATSGFTPGHAVRIDSSGANGKFYLSSEL